MAQLKDLLVNGQTRLIGNTNINGQTNIQNELVANKGLNTKMPDSTTSTDGSESEGIYTPVKWVFDGLTNEQTLKDGDMFTLKVPTTTGADWGIFLSVDNGTTFYPVACQGTTRLTSQYGAGNYITVIFESAGSVDSVFPLTGGTARVTVSGGRWKVVNYYSGDGGISYTLSISGSIITLTGSDSSTSSITLPIYNGGVT